MESVVMWVALIVAGAALFLAWKSSLEVATANRRLDRYNRALFDAGEKARRLEENLTATATQLRVEILRQSGHLAVHPEMTVGEVTALHPQAEQVLAGLHIGGCNSCAVSPDASLAGICADKGMDLNLVMGNLNSLLKAGMASANLGSPSPQPVKVPNIQLSL